MPLSRAFELVTFKQLFLDDRDRILTPRGGFVIFNKDVDALQVYITSLTDIPTWQQLLSYYNNDAYPANNQVAVWNATTERFELITGGAAHTLLDGDRHTDTTANAVSAGSIIMANATPEWTELQRNLPSAGFLNVLGLTSGAVQPAWTGIFDDDANPEDVAAASADGTDIFASRRDHVHDHPTALHAAGGGAVLYSPHTYVFVADADLDADVAVGDNQMGQFHHSYDNAETVKRIITEFETAPTGSAATIQVEYGDTDDLDTVASWTEIDAVTHTAAAKTIITTSFTNSSIPANRLIRMNVDAVGSTVAGKNLSVHMQALRPLVSS